jgi:hypothetical protein
VGLGAPIELGQIRQLLVEACPSFGTSDQLRQFDKDVGDKETEYLLAAAFIRHLVALHLQDRHEEFEAVFDLIERLHLQGDPYVRELATVGFLEDLGNTNLHHRGSTPRDFEKYLRPESRWWWEELELLWAGKIPYLGGSSRPRPT